MAYLASFHPTKQNKKTRNKPDEHSGELEVESATPREKRHERVFLSPRSARHHESVAFPFASFSLQIFGYRLQHLHHTIRRGCGCFIRGGGGGGESIKRRRHDSKQVAQHKHVEMTAGGRPTLHEEAWADNRQGHPLYITCKGSDAQSTPA